MSASILSTKLYIPPPRPGLVLRPRLVEQLNAGLHRKLTLVSAPAGFGKTTLLSAWLFQMEAATTVAERSGVAAHRRAASSSHQPRVAWLSLDAGDNDPARFLSYFVAAVQTIAPHFGTTLLALLQSPQPPPLETLLTALLNEITTIPYDVVLVLDDYHLVDAGAVDQALGFLLEHLPPSLHLVIATREDPPLPLARLRARAHLSELRAADLRFTLAEAATFFNQATGLALAADDIAALETRTEGWIAGLQLAALSLQGQHDTSAFIASFTGSHYFVLDYLLEEVLHRQTAAVQDFLLCTSILERLCGPLCDAVLSDHAGSGQATLEYLDRANLFLVPLDNERRWYRYHHLFADLLRQRLQQHTAAQTSDPAELHIRASAWYEGQGLQLEAFQHAAAANDVARAARLIEGEGMPLHFRGAAVPVLRWLETLPASVLDARPALWVTCAAVLAVTGRISRVEQKLQAAEAALPAGELDVTTRNLSGQIAAIRAMMAAPTYQVDAIIAQAQRALEYLHPANLPLRTAVTRTLGIAYQFQGQRAAASQAYSESIAMSEASGNLFVNILATTGLGIIQESNNQLRLAEQTYRRVLGLVGEPPQPIACEAYFGLARLWYEWNDLDAAREYGRQSLQLAQQIELIDSPVAVELFLARLKLAQGDEAGAALLLAQADQAVRQHNYVQRMPELVAVQVLLLLHQGKLAAAAQLAQSHQLPLSQARVCLTQGDPARALALLEPVLQQAAAQQWPDQQLKVMILQTLALYAQGTTDQAVQLLAETLALAESGGFVRSFVDEGMPMQQLLEMVREADLSLSAYVATVVAAFAQLPTLRPAARISHPAVEPLSQRELEILRLVAQGLSNRQIGERLVLALDTVKGHNRRIYDKLHVQRRTEAVARARELGLL